MGIISDMFTNAFNFASNHSTNYNNRQAVRETNAANLEIAREANNLQKQMYDQSFDYTRATQQTTWDREDTAYQRAVQDARTAGLSPLAVSGGAASGSIVSAPSAPNMNVPTMQASRMNAPQLGSMNGLSEMIELSLANKQLGLEERRLNIEESKIDKDLSHREKQLSQNKDQFDRELKQTNDMLSTRLTHESNEKTKDRLQRLLEFSNSILLQSRAQTHKEQIETQKLMMEKSQHLMSRASGVTGGRSNHYRAYDNWEEYQTAKRAWDQNFESVMSVAYLGYQGGSESQNTAVGGGLSIAGTGGNFNVAGGNSDSVQQWANKPEATITRWLSKNPVPIYYPNMQRSK